MKRKSIPSITNIVRCLAMAMTFVATCAFTQDVAHPLHKKTLALKPPLGWNSYDSYRCQINEEEAMRNLDIFAQKLAPHGYEYFVIDFGWYCEGACVPGSLRPWGNDAFDYSLDTNGYPIGSRTYFPHGMKRIADSAHALGVKFGLHMMRGMLRKAWEFNLPVKGTPYRMRDIADTKNICSWATYTYGVDMNKPGAQEYYDGLIQHLAEMGVDFIKYDDLVPFPTEMEAIGKAVAKCKRDIVLSLSPGDDTTPKNKEHYQWGHMLRITSDVWDTRHCLDSSFQRWRDWQGSAEPGFWPDMDMLCLGRLCGMIDPGGHEKRRAMKPEEIGRTDLEEVFFRPCHFTGAQERTFMTMRALCASPMFMGGCLIRSEQRVIDLITNRDLLACNQNGVCGTLQSEQKPVETWRTPKVKTSGNGWIGVFNRSETQSITCTLSLKELGLSDGNYRFRSIWTNEVFAPGQPVAIAPNDVLFLEYSAIPKS